MSTNNQFKTKEYKTQKSLLLCMEKNSRATPPPPRISAHIRGWSAKTTSLCNPRRLPRPTLERTAQLGSANSQDLKLWIQALPASVGPAWRCDDPPPSARRFRPAAARSGSSAPPPPPPPPLLQHRPFFEGTVITRWIWRLMTCMVSFRPKRRMGPFLTFFSCSNDFIMQAKKCISRGKYEFTLAF